MKVRLQLSCYGSPTVEMTASEYKDLCRRLDAETTVEIGETAVDFDEVAQFMDLHITQAEKVGR